MWIIEPQAGIFEASKEALLRGLTSQLHHRTNLTNPGGMSQNQELGLLMSSLETGSGQPIMDAVYVLLVNLQIGASSKFCHGLGAILGVHPQILFARPSCSSLLHQIES
jgi:hypothetical protein